MRCIPWLLACVFSVGTAFAQGVSPGGSGGGGAVTQASEYPLGAIPVAAPASGTTLATTATLPASATLKTYLCGFSIRSNATAVTTALSQVTGLVGGTAQFVAWIPANTNALGLNEEGFTHCIPSSAINTPVSVTSAAPGLGGIVTVYVWGYQAP
jgi:hypothetical protein